MATERYGAPRVFGVEMNRTGERLFANCFGCIMVRVEIAGEVVSPGTPYCYRVADDILRWAAGPEDCGRGIELVLSGIADAINAAREAAKGRRNVDEAVAPASKEPWEVAEVERLKRKLDSLPERFDLSGFVRAGLSLDQASAALLVARRVLEDAEREP